MRELRAKMEAAIKKIDGVVDAKKSDVHDSKLVVEADDARFDEIMDEAQAILEKSKTIVKSYVKSQAG